MYNYWQSIAALIIANCYSAASTREYVHARVISSLMSWYFDVFRWRCVEGGVRLKWGMLVVWMLPMSRYEFNLFIRPNDFKYNYNPISSSRHLANGIASIDDCFKILH